MSWYNLQDQYGNHYFIPTGLSPVSYITSAAVDGSQPIFMILNNGLKFTITLTQATVIIGTLPASIQVEV